MRTAARELTDAQLRGAKLPAGKSVAEWSDRREPGLFFRLRKLQAPPGAKSPQLWRGFFYRFTPPGGGARRKLLLGTYDDGSRRDAPTVALGGPESDEGRARLSLSQARALAAQYRAQVRAGHDPLEVREARKAAAKMRRKVAADEAAEEKARRRALAEGKALPGTFADLAARYLRDHAKGRKRSWREDARKLQRDVLPEWGARRAGEITRADVRELVRAIAAGEGNRARPGRPAPVAADRVLALVSKVFTFGLDAEFPGLVGNPAYRIARPAAKSERDRYLSDVEIRALWAATGEELPLPRVAIRLLLLTGMRRGELLGARWRDLVSDDFGAWLEVGADRSKNKRPLRAAISGLAREVLEDLPAGRPGDLIFPGADARRHLSDLKGPLRRIRERVAALAGEGADPRPWTIHDLRRTFRTKLAALQIPFAIAERLLGHVTAESRGVAATYDRHGYAAERMAAVETLARHVRELLTGERGNVLPFQVGSGSSGPGGRMSR